MLKNIYHQLQKPAQKEFSLQQLYLTTLLESYCDEIHTDLLEYTAVPLSWHAPHAEHSIDAAHGIINEAFLQLHWSFVTDLQTLLNRAKLRTDKSADKDAHSSTAALHNSRPVKKVIPIHTSLPTIVESSKPNADLQKQLRQWFFWQHPELKALSEFVSERIVYNSCTHAISFSVAEIVEVKITTH